MTKEGGGDADVGTFGEIKWICRSFFSILEGDLNKVGNGSLLLAAA